MKNNILSHSCNNPIKLTYDVLGDLKVQVNITHNPYDIPPDCLFSMAARVNKKRSFLFVSKILGKHIPVQPHVSLLSGASLSLLINERAGGQCKESLMRDIVQAFQQPAKAREAYEKLGRENLEPPMELKMIGFAETATAIGHSAYEAFRAGVGYFHTTREQVFFGGSRIDSAIHFEEEHSHATSHYCYPQAVNFLQGTDPVVLIDDEITTGKTSLNIIREIQRKYPRTTYIVAALLDWRTAEDEEAYARLENEMGITIQVVSLLKGTIQVTGGPIEQAKPLQMSAPVVRPQYGVVNVAEDFAHVPFYSADCKGDVNAAVYLRHTGRFGLEPEHNRDLNDSVARTAERLRALRLGGKTLCLGTGEFMFIPMRIAAEMGDQVYYQSTTRSPIHPSPEQGYAIQSAYAYPSPDDEQIVHYLYNVKGHSYTDLFVFLERETGPGQLLPFKRALDQLDIPQITFVFFSPPTYDLKELFL